MVDGEQQQEEAVEEEEDADSISVTGSVTSESSQKQNAVGEQKQHKRSKSGLAGLKKLGGSFGGLRKKEDKESVALSS